MDPFTQRLVERAKIRKEQLDSRKNTNQNLASKLNALAEQFKSDQAELELQQKHKEKLPLSEKKNLNIIAESNPPASSKKLVTEVKLTFSEKKTNSNFSQTREVKPIMKKMEKDPAELPLSERKALFAAAESKLDRPSPKKLVKDPAELPISERKALFEKNKGEALLPKVAFAQSLPAKKWDEIQSGLKTPVKTIDEMNNEKENRKNCEIAEKKTKISSYKNLFEKKDENSSKENDYKSDVLKEMEYLKNRWNHNKEIASKASNEVCNTSAPVKAPATPLSPPPPPPLPPPSSSSLTNSMFESKNVSKHISETSMETFCNDKGVIENRQVSCRLFGTPEKYHDSPETIKLVKEVKRIESSPAKAGRLYPSLSDIEVADESDISSSECNSMNESKNSNIYLNMSFGDIIEASRNNPITPPRDHSFSKSDECHVLAKMDEYLEEALGDISSSDEDGGPTPPKMSKSTSFEYKRNDSTPDSNLIHTVSFYRKQQQNSIQSTPVKIIRRGNTPEKSDRQEVDENLLVENRISELLQEVNNQQESISQASKALNYCLSKEKFLKQQAESERLLLLANHKRQACLNEIQRLKVENTLRPKGSVCGLNGKGSITITDIVLPLRREALSAIAQEESILYLVCLVKCEDQVKATSAIPATSEHLSNKGLHISGKIKLEKLLSDFKVTFEVYYLRLHHLKKEKKLLTPIKSKKSESKLATPRIQSPAGPYAVRTTNFQLCGFAVFSLREVSRTQWTLNKNANPLEGSMSMKILPELKLDSEFRGFLTVFDDISGFGAWHRRWCLLSSHNLSFWKYPDDENRKDPMETIDLTAVVNESIGLVSREICARLNTFLLETTRPRLETDKESLILNIEGEVTKVRHLLAADSKEEMSDWCRVINSTLALLRLWRCNLTS